jgi:hypothetical protein
LIPGRNLDLLARWRDYRWFRGHNFASAGETTAFSRSLFCRIGDACVPGTLLAWLLGPVEVVGRVDERDVGERLGEIANKALRLRIVFLRE